MKKIIKVLILSVIISSLIGGCIPSRDYTTNFVQAPALEAVNSADIELDFEQLQYDVSEAFGDISESPYIFVENVQLQGNNDTKEIYIYETLIEEAGASEARHFTVALMRHLNDAACSQYEQNFELSSPESFGTLFDYYSFYVNAVHSGSEDVIYALSKEAGEETDLDPDMESYEDEWNQHILNYLENQNNENAAADEGIVLVNPTTASETSEEEMSGEETSGETNDESFDTENTEESTEEASAEESSADETE